MFNDFKTFTDFLNEDVNTDIAEAKLRIAEIKEKISTEVNKRNEMSTMEDRAKSIEAEAILYQQMPPLLRNLAAKMMAKAKSGDKSNTY